MAIIIKGKSKIKFKLRNPETNEIINYYLEGEEDLSFKLPDEFENYDIIVPEDMKDKLKIERV